MRIDNKLGFIHIPKTGGQSIENYLLSNFSLQRDVALLKRNTDPLLGPPRLAHLTIEEYAEIYQYRPKAWFALVRHPSDRFLSEIKFRGLSAEQAEVYFNKVQFRLLTDEYRTGEDFLRHSLHQTDFFAPGATVRMMQFERFMRAPIRYLSELMDRDLEAAFPHITPKASRVKMGKVSLNRTTERKLEDFYAKDFELWSRCGEDAWAEETFPIEWRDHLK